jgi:hypothetical protein
MRDVLRCVICGLPLPEGDDGGEVCSRRCAGRRAEARALRHEADKHRVRILEEVGSLRRGTTICPGELALRVLPGTDNPLQILRPFLQELAEEKKLRWLQKGKVVWWEKVRGPFRVGPPK